MTAAVSFAKTDISGMDNVIYPEDAKGQVGGTATIKVKIKANVPLANFQWNAIKGLPAGVTYKGGTSPLSGYGVADGAVFVVSTTNPSNYFEAGTYTLAELAYDVDPSVPVGDYEITIPQSYIGSSDLAQSVEVTTPISATLTIQRAAVVGEFDPNNALEVIPFTLTKGITDASPVSIPIYAKSKDKLTSVTFNVELPAGVRIAEENVDGEMLPKMAKISNANGSLSGVYDFVGGAGSGKYSFKITGDSRNYIKAASEMTQFATIPLATANDLAAGVYTMKITNVVLGDNQGEYYEGEYYVSFFVGESKGDAILYGHFTDDAKAAAQAALKGGSADITEATVEGDLALNDVLVYGKTNTSYSRNVTAGNYGTICLPYALKSDANVQYYTLSEVQHDKVVFAPADSVAANEPALFKAKDATISSERDGYCLAKTAGTGAEFGGLQLTGTYAPLYLAPEAGYYVSDNKLYNDGATVAPFRAYLAGTAHVNGLRIFIDGETGLEEITDQLSNDDIYNLQGVKLQKTQKGVNIVGGKKIFVK